MIRKLLPRILICIVATIPAAGVERANALQVPDCAGVGDQMAINQCEATDFNKVESALERTYQTLLSSLDSEHRDLLKATQSAWVSFRDASCALEASQALHGSMYDMLFESCRTAATDERNKELNELKSTLSEFIH